MPSPELTEILALVPDGFADPEADYRAVRETMAPFHGQPVPAHVAVTEVELGGVRCAWYENTRRPPSDRVVFHCHGGGLVSCPLEEYHFYGAMLAEQLETRVVMADYRLAPEHPFPAALDDTIAVYRDLLKTYKPAHIALYGTSAGAILTVEVAVRLKQLNLPLPGALGIFSGMGDFSCPANIPGVSGGA